MCLLTLAASAFAGCQDDPDAGPGGGDAGRLVDDADADAETANDDAGDADDAAADNHDTGNDAGFDPLEPTPVQPGVDPDGHAAVDQAVADDRARAGKIVAASTGFTGVWSHCRTGDFKLYNARIAVCIQSETTNLLEVFSGGKLVDAHRIGGPTDDILGFTIPVAGLGTTYADKVEVIRDGSDGGPAVLRVHSHDIPIAHLYGLTGQRLGDRLGLQITTDYRLAPDSNTVEIASWYTNTTDGSRSFFAGDWFGYGDRARLFSPNSGLEVPRSAFGWLASVSQGRSYGWVNSNDQARPLGLASQGIAGVVTRAKSIRLEPGQRDIWRRWFVVGDGTLASIRRRAAQLRGTDLAGRRRTLHVQTSAGQPVADHPVEVSQDGKPVAWQVTDADGNAQFILEDADYDVRVGGWAGGADFDRHVTVSEDTPTISVDPPGHVQLGVTDAAGPLTARVVIDGAHTWEGVALHGQLHLDVAPGDYQVVVSHGPEYDAATANISVTAEQTTSQSLQLGRAFSTDGWISADFHQHMEPSIDSEVRVDDRLLENAAAGVNLAVTTDHETVTDLRGLVDEYDLGEVMATFPGVELSPLETHMGVYPVEPNPDQRGRGTVPLAVLDDQGEPHKRSVPELVSHARMLPSDPIVQLNHARSSPSGLLSQVDYDPMAGPAAVDDDRFTIDFDAIEIINRFSDACALFTDWASLLNAGYHLTGLGNSDTHELDGESGLPRNFLHLDTPIAELTQDDVQQAIRAGRVGVGAHMFMDFADDTLPGDVRTVPAGQTVDFPVRVHTPARAHAQTLVAVANGQVVDTIERRADAGEHLDFDETISISVDRDTWVVFFAYGPSPAGPVDLGKPTLGFLNPVYLDVDGDADHDGDPFEAPGIGPLSLQPLDAACQ